MPRPPNKSDPVEREPIGCDLGTWRCGESAERRRSPAAWAEHSEAVLGPPRQSVSPARYRRPCGPVAPARTGRARRPARRSATRCGCRRAVTASRPRASLRTPPAPAERAAPAPAERACARCGRSRVQRSRARARARTSPGPRATANPARAAPPQRPRPSPSRRQILAEDEQGRDRVIPQRTGEFRRRHGDEDPIEAVSIGGALVALQVLRRELETA